MKSILVPLFVLGLMSFSFAQETDYKKVFEKVYLDYMDSSEVERKKAALQIMGREDLAQSFLDKEQAYLDAVQDVIEEEKSGEAEPKPEFNDFSESDEYKRFVALNSDLSRLESNVKNAKRRLNLSKATYELCVYNNGSSGCSGEYSMMSANRKSYNDLINKYNEKNKDYNDRVDDINAKIRENNRKLQEYRKELNTYANPEPTYLEEKRDRYLRDTKSYIAQIKEVVAEGELKLVKEEERELSEMEVVEFEKLISKREPILESMKKHFTDGYDLDSCNILMKEFMAFFYELDLEELGIKRVIMNNGKDVSYQKHMSHILVLGFETAKREKANYLAFYDGVFMYDCDLFPDDKIKKVGVKKHHNDGYNKMNGLSNWFEYDEDGNLKEIQNQRAKWVIGQRFYHKNGEVARESSYRYGELNGISTWYYDTGEINATCPYKDGKRSGDYKVLFKDGSTKGIVQFRAGKKHGSTRWYYDSGIEKTIISNFEGERHGLCQFNYVNGVTKTIKRYEHGKLMEIVETNDMDGNPVDKGTLVNGNGTCIVYDSENGSFVRVDEYVDGEKVKKD
ncbi:MAG: hypothetical protein P8P74_00140 [Crocinitomicaceae bacterium]|nr:hypothetical protein [Crocinitomicaceae bacterium]